MKIVVIRDTFGSNYTTSQVFVDGVKECVALEDKVREVEGQSVYQWKIAAETAMPRGVYKVIIDHSNRFDRDLPLLINVPGFDGVRIHPGNTDKDTHGCLLVGTERNGDFISESRKAFDK